ncbi:MAG: magnesium transporter [Leptonema sp. (in: bacteria)]
MKPNIVIGDELLEEIRYLISSDSKEIIKNILFDLEFADIALILQYLDFEEQKYLFSLLPENKRSEVIFETNRDVRKKLFLLLKEAEIQKIIEDLETDDAVDLISELPKDTQKRILENLPEEKRKNLLNLLKYEDDTAGGIMSADFVSAFHSDTVKKALKKLKVKLKEGYQIHNIFVVDEEQHLLGVISIYDLLLHNENKKIGKIMKKPEFVVTPEVDQEEIAQVFKKYDLISLPVVDSKGKLIGRITVDDVVDVMEEEHVEDIAKMIGTEAEEIENRSPFKIALMRSPWVLLTLFVEFLAGIVIHFYDDILEKVILLASFMPIISAISGNTGLQSAAVIIRALATGHAKLEEWWKPIIRQLTVTLILGTLLGSVIGIIGTIWHKTIKFGLVVAISMFISINLSGFIGTVTPMISKRLGIDPAITAGPFETAFQDVIGITIFLTLAKLMFEFL